MASQKCDRCGSENIELTSSMHDGRKRYRCTDCRSFWWNKGGRRAGGGAHPGFPRKDPMTPEEAEARYRSLLNRFRTEKLEPSADELAWRDRYRALFAADALATASPADLKDFANVRHVANPGPMSMFNQSWDEMGEEKAAAQVRRTIEHLLHAGDDTGLAGRISAVIEGSDDLGMPGFKETLTTKVFCVARSERFVPILSATGKTGKAAFLQHVFGVSGVPSGASRGEVILWTNDQLAERLREAFPDLLAAGYFLRWARSQP